MSDLSQAFILDRRQKTLAVYATFASEWTWEEGDVSDFTATKAHAEASVDAVEALRMTMLGKRDDLDQALDMQAAQTLTVVGLARVKFRADRSKKSMLATLSARGDSRVAVRAEAKALAKAWPKLDAAWVPRPGLTLAAYVAQRKVIEGDDLASPAVPGLVDFYEDAHADWRAAAEELNLELRELEDANEAWYAAATVVFPAGTPQGDLIRGQVPTTYDPANEPLPAPGTPTGLAAGPGGTTGAVNVVCLPVAYATDYEALVQWTAGGTAHSQSFPAATNHFTCTGLPSGVVVSVTLTASNATGTSAPTAPQTTTVP